MTTGQAELMEPTAHPQAVTPPSDEELLERIARSNDRPAFEDLAHRFSKLAYNLALNLCGNAGLAEDAVQDAMVDVWLRARHFDPARGRARSWILRIVANKTLTLRTRESREKKRIQVKRAEARAETEAPQERTGDGGDLGAALRQTMTRLSEAERQIVAMYYGAELTQDEIAHSLDISQRTVSLRLQQSLEKLRRNLSAAGFAASLPLLEAGKLGDALLATEAVPPGLHAGILRALALGAGQSARGVATGASAKWWGLAALVFFAACAAGAAAWWPASRPPQEGTSEPDAIPAPEPNASAAKSPGIEPAAADRIVGHWTFDKSGSDSNFEVLDGAWAWDPRAGRDGTGAMCTKDRVLVAIGADLPIGAYLLTFDMSNQTSRQIQGGACWEHEGTSIVLTNRSVMVPPAHTDWVRVSIFVTDDLRLAKVENAVRWLVFAKRSAGARLVISLVGQVAIDNISLARIRESSLPDIRPYRALIDAIPTAERHDTVKRRLRTGTTEQNISIFFGTANVDRKR